MPVTLACLAVIFLNLYFRSCTGDFKREGVWLGVNWLLINILLDLPLFSWGPMKMPLISYLADIGLTYLMLPVITIGAGAMLARLRERLQ